MNSPSASTSGRSPAATASALPPLAAFKPTRFQSSAPKCPRCEKSVYAAEEAKGPGSQSYHKMCLKCAECGKRLEPINLLEHEGEPFCKACHLKNFGPKGYGFGGSVSGDYADRLGTPSPQSSPNKPRGGGILPLSAKAILRQQQQQQQQFNDYEDDGDTSSLPASPSRPSSRPGTPSRGAPSSDDRCRRCGQMAYFAERVRAANNTWHKLCLRCTQCSKSLDSNLLVSDDLPYCKKCHQERSGIASMKLN